MKEYIKNLIGSITDNYQPQFINKTEDVTFLKCPQSTMHVQIIFRRLISAATRAFVRYHNSKGIVV